jgi:DNA-binding IclR family transcriptional regulator
MLHRVPIEVKARAEGMSGYLQRVLLELLNNLEYGLTPLRAAQMLWGNNATDANRNAIRRALSALERRGLAQRDLGGRRYYANSRAKFCC